jgi:hypothetical protein
MLRQILLGVFMVSSTMSRAAEPAKLLACQGHTQYLEADSHLSSVSLGIVVNLADRTVQGFRYPEDFPIQITHITETMIIFHGSTSHAPGTTYRQINGRIDRVTGDAQTTSDVTTWTESEAIAIHSLKCKPAQGIF